jgi:hypothetical protein
MLPCRITASDKAVQAAPNALTMALRSRCCGKLDQAIESSNSVDGLPAAEDYQTSTADCISSLRGSSKRRTHAHIALISSLDITLKLVHHSSNTENAYPRFSGPIVDELWPDLQAQHEEMEPS